MRDAMHTHGSLLTSVDSIRLLSFPYVMGSSMYNCKQKELHWIKYNTSRWELLHPKKQEKDTPFLTNKHLKKVLHGKNRIHTYTTPNLTVHIQRCKLKNLCMYRTHSKLRPPFLLVRFSYKYGGGLIIEYV